MDYTQQQDWQEDGSWDQFDDQDLFEAEQQSQPQNNNNDYQQDDNYIQEDDQDFVDGPYNDDPYYQDDTNQNYYDDNNINFNTNTNSNTNPNRNQRKNVSSSKYKPIRPKPKSTLRPSRNKNNNNSNNNNTNNNTSSNTRSVRGGRLRPTVKKHEEPHTNNRVNTDQIGNLISGIKTGNMATDMAKDIIASKLKDNDQLREFLDALPSQSIFSLRYYRYYFTVDNMYILKKFKLLFLPFIKWKKKDWKRKAILGGNDVSANVPSNGGVVRSLSPDKTKSSQRLLLNAYYEPAVNDVNAPDLYLPLMAVITYIFIMGILIGTGENSNKFTPQVLIGTGSSAFGMMLFEFFLLVFSLWVLNTSKKSVIRYNYLDLFCYIGYKLIYVIFNLVIFLFNDNIILYYVVSVSTGIFAALFMMQTLRAYFIEETDKSQKIFLLVVGVLELIFIQLMGRYTY